MAQVTNPFDDSFVEESAKSPPALPSNNPFDDVDVLAPSASIPPQSSLKSNNPFDDSSSSSSSDHSDGRNDIPSDLNDDDDDEDQAYTYPPPPMLSTSTTAAAEASWQYLGDLPYRRVPIYHHVQWNTAEPGLAHFPPSVLAQRPPNNDAKRKSSAMDPRDHRALLNTTTVTKVEGCPHGGPIAAVTVPLVGGETVGFNTTELRILTNAGTPLSTIEFPPSQLPRRYAPADILTIGFTDRTALIVVLRDSLVLVYQLDGTLLLPPFFSLPRGEGKGTELLQARVYEGGVAVLSTNKQAALVELLDEHDDPVYYSGAHISARRILPSYTAPTDAFGGSQSDARPPHYAIVTPLNTADFGNDHFFGYLSIAVLPRFHSLTRHPEVFLSTTDNSVVVVHAATTEITDVNCRSRISSPIVDMTFAPNGRFLACFTESSMLTVISTSFETKVLDFDTSEGSSAPPLQMKWCGEDSVVLHWKNLGVLMVGPYGDWLRFPYKDTENLYLIPEIDCCRVITDSSVEILQRVPPATALLLRIGSIEPSAMLLDASDAFESGSPASDDAARAITKTGMLQDAIETCTEAATREFDITTQKRLMRAASYGMHFSYKDPDESRNVMGGSGDAEEDGVMPSPTAVKFVAAARKIRILNAMRNPSVGFVLTSAQFDAITPNGVIARLIAMKRPALATSISKYLGLPKSVQLFARASKAAAFVAADRAHTDAETAEAAIRILHEEESPVVRHSSVNRGGYASVALAANRAGRPGVANLLLMLESSVADKIPALISTGSYSDAMAVATTARDADFIFLTLMECEKSCMAAAPDISRGHSSFLGTVVSKFTPEGFHTLRRYLGTTPDVKNVANLLLRAQKYADAGVVIARRAIHKTGDSHGRQEMLTEASRIFGLGKDTGFYKSCTDDYLELLKDQEILRRKYGNVQAAPESSSVASTIASVIRFGAQNQREQHRLLADADKLGKKFRVPEKRMWYLKVKAFADSEQWSNLRILMESKTKSPIGYKPFARAAIKGKQPVSEIMRYIDRVIDFEERYDLFCEAAMWKKALDEAAKLKDGRRIMNVKTLCGNAETQMLADQMLARLA